MMKKIGLVAFAALILCSGCSTNPAVNSTPNQTPHTASPLFSAEYAADGSLISADFITEAGDRISVSEFAHPNGTDYPDTLTYKFDGVTYRIDPKAPSSVETTFNIGVDAYSIFVEDSIITLENENDGSTQAVAALPEGGAYSPIHIAGLEDYAILLRVPSGVPDQVQDNIYVYVLQGTEWVQAKFLLPSGNTADTLLGHARRKFITAENAMDPQFNDEDLGKLEVCLPGDGESTMLYSVNYDGTGQLNLKEIEVYPEGVPETWHF